MVVVRGRLTPEAGAVLMRALDAVREALYQEGRQQTFDAPPDVSAETPARAQPQADALALLAETALHHGVDPGAPGERYQVAVHVDAPVLPGRAGSVCPRRRRARFRGNVSASRVRTIPPALRRALHHRDRSCRFPGCHVRFGQGHHIRHWAQGGPTTLSNLTLWCSRHHRGVHEEGYQVVRGADGELCFRRPDGRILPEVPLPGGDLTIPLACYEHGTIGRASSFARTPRRPDGSGSVSTSGMRSTFCVLGAREVDSPTGKRRARAAFIPSGCRCQSKVTVLLL
jgi:HNH endonuclease/Domain of unknown function (DUF222)